MRLGLGVVGTLVVVSSTLPIFMAIIIPILFAYYLMQKFYVTTSRQLRRLESSTRSPIYSWFGESISGVSTIKAFEMDEEFCHEMENKVDNNGRTIMPKTTLQTDGAQSKWRFLVTQLFSLLPCWPFLVETLWSQAWLDCLCPMQCK